MRNSELALAREKARLEDMELNVSHLLTTAIQNLDYNYLNAQTHFNRWVAAEKEVEALTALVKGGKATVNLVLDGQRRRANAQADFYRSIVEYNKAIANVHFRKGSLLEYNNITLAEGPWPKKAYWDALGRARERDASYYLDYGSTRPRVVSQGPVDQGGTTGLIEQYDPGIMDMNIEQIPTPAAEPADTPLGEPMNMPPLDSESMDMDPMDMVPMDLGPTTSSPQGSIFDGPTLGLDDDAPPRLVQEPGDRQPSHALVGDRVRQADHQQAIRR